MDPENIDGVSAGFSSWADSVVIPNWRAWSARGPQLAQLLMHRTHWGPDDPDGACSALESSMTVVDTAYWSHHVAELCAALGASPDRSASSSRNSGAAFAADASERLTMSVEEVASALGISRAFAYEAIHRGEIPYIRIGRRLLIPRAALSRLVARSENKVEGA